MKDQHYAMVTETPYSWPEAMEKIKGYLKEEGFGILTEIDVRATMKDKLGLDYRNYTILGACNPPFAHRALEVEALVGVFLPCNVLVYEDHEGQTMVAAMEPRLMPRIIDNPELAAVAEEVGARLERALMRMKVK